MAGSLTRITMAIAGAGAVLLAASPAMAQQRSTHVHDDGHVRREIVMSGQIDFTDDDGGVARISEGGRLTVEEHRRGQPRRRVEWRGTGDGARMQYYENDDLATPDADDRAWISRTLRDAVLESGLGAERRVERIRLRRGVDGVLEEIARMRSDGAKRHYYVALLRGRTSTGETTRVLRHVSSHVRSDSEKRLTLSTVLRGGDLGRDEAIALFQAAEGIGSDSEAGLLLREAARRHPPADERAAAAFFRATAGIGSDAEKSLVLRQVARQAPLEREGVRAAFFRASDSVGSDSEQALVLRSVLHGEATPAVAAAAIRSARGIGSDAEKALVLRAVPSHLLRDTSVREAYRQALATFRTDSHRDLARRHLDRSAR